MKKRKNLVKPRDEKRQKIGWTKGGVWLILNPMLIISKIIQVMEALSASSLFWGIVSLVISAITLSGRFSLRSADTVLIIAWLVALVGIFRGNPVADFQLIPRVLITMLCVSVLGLGFYRLSLWFHKQDIAESFNVEVRSALVSDSGPLTLFMVGYPSMFGQTVSPVFYLTYISITNLQDVAITINDLKIAASKESTGPWEELVAIPLKSTSLYMLGIKTPSPTEIEMMHGTLRLATQMMLEDMKHAALLTANPILESELTNLIEPHHSISGWVAFDSRTSAVRLND